MKNGKISELYYLTVNNYWNKLSSHLEYLTTEVSFYLVFMQKFAICIFRQILQFAFSDFLIFTFLFFYISSSKNATTFARETQGDSAP